MKRYKITLEYDGGPFAGWQRQKTALSVQEVVEDAIAAFCGEAVRIHGAGRTDAGVHARAQVAHFDLERDDITTKTVRDAINHHTRPYPISILDVEITDDAFHARFSATERKYLFRILNRRARPALDRGQVWWVPVPLDAVAMHEAAQVLIGRHDFTTFRASQCQARSPLKTLSELSVSRLGDEIHIHVRARSFLHHQVRNFAGTLKLVGEGRWTREDVRRALLAKDRAHGGPTAPPDGLYLMSVGYTSDKDDTDAQSGA